METNGNRPRASSTTVVNLVLGVTAVATLVLGGVWSVADIKADVKVLQNQTSYLQSQVGEIKADVREVVKAVRDAQGGKR